MSQAVKKKQYRNYLLAVGLLALIVIAMVFFSKEEGPLQTANLIPEGYTEEAFPTEDPTFSSDRVRLSHIENQADLLQENIDRLERAIERLAEDKTLLEINNRSLEEETHLLRDQLIEITKIQEAVDENQALKGPETIPNEIASWGKPSSFSKRNVATEIPAGTVVKCLLVSSADCGVGVNTASDPHTVLLQPLANGKLPKNVQVALKGSRIIGSAVGDIASERVRIRTERLTLMLNKGGDFIETSISGFVSGEDGKEGLRGVVVDRSGSIITRAAFASFLQGVGQSVQATLNNQTIEKLAKVGGTQSILDVDTFRNAGIQGGNTGLNKLAEYYIKRAEQLQPVIQIQAGRIVDVIFLKTVELGEKDIKKKIEAERMARSLS